MQDNIPLEKHGLDMGDTHSNTVLYEEGYIYNLPSLFFSVAGSNIIFSQWNI